MGLVIISLAEMASMYAQDISSLQRSQLTHTEAGHQLQVDSTIGSPSLLRHGTRNS